MQGRFPGRDPWGYISEGFQGKAYPTIAFRREWMILLGRIEVCLKYSSSSHKTLLSISVSTLYFYTLRCLHNLHSRTTDLSTNMFYPFLSPHPWISVNAAMEKCSPRQAPSHQCAVTSGLNLWLCQMCASTKFVQGCHPILL